MLKYLSIKNLLLIDKIDFTFNEGLCVLTGETGAGKSMILDSLNLVSGERAKNSFKPEKGKITSVSALFDIKKFIKVKKKIQDLGVEHDEEIIIKRVINDDGKSKAFINDNLVGLTVLKEITGNLIEIHSQFSEQGLLDSSTHIDTLDEYGDYKNDLDELYILWRNFKNIELNYHKKKAEYETLKDEKETIKYDLNELKSLNPIQNEVIELNKKKKILQNSAKITEHLNKINQNFTSDNPAGIEVLLSKNINLLDDLRTLLDENSIKEIDSLTSLSIEISEIAKYFKDLSNEEFDNQSLDDIEERLFLYKKISRKHKIEENEIIDFLQNLEIKLSSNENHMESLKNLENKLKNVKEQYEEKAKKVSSLRKKFASDLDQKINSEFPQLKLETAMFKTSIEENPMCENGIDRVLFQIRTNPKSQMDEIKKISSGGELCRIALAIKVIAQKKSNSSMVFDEVDSGIGGAVSTAVGERLRKLGKGRQVLIVTHSPQVAALGNDHFIVRKINSNFGTDILIKKLNFEDKVTEIARMLSGKKITQEALLAAKKLLDNSS